MTDEVVFKRYIDTGNPDDFAEIYNRYQKRTLAYLQKVYDLEQATKEDLCQEVFVTLLEYGHTYDGRRFESWFFCVVGTVVANWMRARKTLKRNMTTWSLDVEVQDERAPQTENMMEIKFLMASLPSAEQEIIHRRYNERRSFKEISEKTGIPMGTVKSRASRALDRMRAAS